MKKELLSILSVLFTAMLVNAQDITTYRGAFAPAPVRQWTEGWANFDAQNTVYPATNVSIPAGNLTTQTWTSNNTYLITGLVYVPSGVTLTIEPGTVIRGNGGNSSLLVSRGGKLIAEGTVCKPIVFTSNNAPGARSAGNWGGILLLGKAKHNLGTNNQIEGLDNTNNNNFHGGTDDNDNSGVLKYVRIEFPGFIFSANNEINGLTMGSVGRGTTIDYVQVTRSDDDAFEWFGGSVNCKHLIAYQNKDDDWDTDNGFSGIVQYGLSIKDPAFADASTSEGFESDNSANGVNIGQPSSAVVGAPLVQAPKTSAAFYNITQIGAFRCNGNAGPATAPSSLLFSRGARLRRNTDLKIFNSLILANYRGLHIDDAIVTGFATAPTTVNFNEDSAAFRNNIIAGDLTTSWAVGTTYVGPSLAYFNTATSTIATLAAYENTVVNSCALLTDPWNANPSLADFRPDAAFAGGNPLSDPAGLTSGADLNPFIDILGGLFTANESKEFNVFVLENNGGSSNGAITLTIPGLSGWTINVGNTQASDNLNWNFTTAPDGTVTATSKPGQVVEKNGFRQLGFTAVRKGTTPTGTNQNLSVNISGGGDVTPGNNGQVTIFSAN
jgi:hypothetical protein